MKAIQYRAYGGPELSNGDVLVEMRTLAGCARRISG
jgi:hypothetical protein